MSILRKGCFALSILKIEGPRAAHDGPEWSLVRAGDRRHLDNGL